eukprot:scaffold20426_cov146-Isochrysis_galbana.AAC.1
MRPELRIALATEAAGLHALALARRGCKAPEAIRMCAGPMGRREVLRGHARQRRIVEGHRLLIEREILWYAEDGDEVSNAPTMKTARTRSTNLRPCCDFAFYYYYRFAFASSSAIRCLISASFSA